jgi:hypothetical protein
MKPRCEPTVHQSLMNFPTNYFSIAIPALEKIEIPRRQVPAYSYQLLKHTFASLIDEHFGFVQHEFFCILL